MTVSRGFRRLASVLEDLETDGLDVVDVAVPAEHSTDGADRLVADLTIAIPIDDASADETTISVAQAEPPAAEPPATSEPSTVRATVSETLDPAPAVDDEGAASEPAAVVTETVEEAADESDAGVPCPHPGCDERFDSEPGMKIHRTKVHAGDGGDGDDETPTHRNPEALRTAYEEHDTFVEMRDALGVDVSAQTVRRQLIKHGIHDPETAAAEDGGDDDSDANDDDSSDRTADASAEDDPAGQEATDAAPEPEDRLAGVDLAAVLPADVDAPADVTIADLRDCVESADTLYDVQRTFDVDRPTAQSVLDALDLLELVHGRVATRFEREELKEEIDARIATNLDGASA